MLFTGHKKAFKKVDERGRLLKILRESAETGDLEKMDSARSCLLYDHADYLLLPVVMTEIIDTLAKKDMQAGIRMALYLTGNQNSNDLDKNIDYKKIQQAAVEKSFELLERLDKNNAKDMASAAVLSGAIAEAVEAGSDTEARAVCQWSEAMDVLALKDVKNYALAAACNATVLGSRALSETAIKKWEKILTTLVREDKELAADLAKKFAEKCARFDEKQHVPFKQRSSALARKLS